MRSENSEGILTIFLQGDIDAQNAAEIQREMEEILKSREKDVLVLDARDLTYISSAGLRVMLAIQKEFNTRISIINLSAEVLAIFQMAGFQHLLQHKDEHMPKELPVANYEVVADYVPYVYYLPEQLRQGIIVAKGNQAEAYVGADFKQYNMLLRKYFLFIVIGTVLFFVVTLYLILKRNVQMARGFAVPINSLTEGVREIAGGNLQRKLFLKTGDELETLADSFNHMMEELADYMEKLAKTTAQKERIDTELAVATRIQTGLLPQGQQPFPERKDFDLAAMMKPAREVGGDFYDFYFLECRA